MKMVLLYLIKSALLEKVSLQDIVADLHIHPDLVIGNEGQGRARLQFSSMLDVCLTLSRHLNLLRDDRTLVMSPEDEAAKIALTMAGLQKQAGDDVRVSDVLEALDQVSAAASPDGKLAGQLAEDIRSDLNMGSMVGRCVRDHLDDLQRHNLVGFSRILSSLRRKLSELKAGSQESGPPSICDLFPREFTVVREVIIVCPSSFSSPRCLDKEAASLLFPEEKFSLQEIVLPLSFDDSFGPDASFEKNSISSPVTLSGISWKDFCTFEHQEPQAGGAASSNQDEKYTLQLFSGYLRLLVNSRDELSLARIVAGPGGAMDQEAFNAIKKEASKTSLPIFQMVVSFAQKLRLGGKGYDPAEEHPLFPYCQQMVNLVNLVDKLQTMIEEEKNAQTALSKIISSVKRHIQRQNTSGRWKMSRLDEVCDRILSGASNIEAREKELSNGQSEVASGGGQKKPGLSGQKNLETVRRAVDFLATCIATTGTVNVHALLGKVDAGKLGSTGKRSSPSAASQSPIAYPNVISLYNTPILSEKPDPSEAQDKQEFIVKAQPGGGVPRFTSTLAWATETSPIVVEASPPYQFNSVEVEGTIEVTTNPVILQAKNEAEHELAIAKEALKQIRKGCQKRSILSEINQISRTRKKIKTSFEETDSTCKKQKDNKFNKAPVSGAENEDPSSGCVLQRATATKKVVPTAAKKTGKKLKEPPKGQPKISSFFRL